MDKIYHYLQAAAKKVADKPEKPLTLVTTMAFLFLCMVLLPIARFPLLENLLINAAIATLILLLVLILTHVHGRDIRALQARLDEFAVEQETLSRAQAEDKLNSDEIRRIRTLISEQASVTDDDARRPNRDKRPSLF
jgi:low affinity Fe/Cu permease